jgi:hypothetical protein
MLMALTACTLRAYADRPVSSHSGPAARVGWRGSVMKQPEACPGQRHSELGAGGGHFRGPGGAARLDHVPDADLAGVLDVVAKWQVAVRSERDLIQPLDPLSPGRVAGASGPPGNSRLNSARWPGVMSPSASRTCQFSRSCLGMPGSIGSARIRSCRRSHQIRVFAADSFTQSTRLCWPAPIPSVIPSRTNATEFDCV